MWEERFYVRSGRRVMSRIGKNPITLPQGVEVLSEGGKVFVKGKGGTLKVPLWPHLKIKHEEKRVVVERAAEDSKTRSFHGLCRALIQNAVTGVSQGWSKSLELNGVGYKANVSGKKLELNLGYSHPISFSIPEGIEIKVDKQTSLKISGADRELVGQTAHTIRSFRPPEPYLGKGVKYTDEIIRRKAGKTGGDKK